MGRPLGAGGDRGHSWGTDDPTFALRIGHAKGLRASLGRGRQGWRRQRLAVQVPVARA